jgi:hypothetical protein
VLFIDGGRHSLPARGGHVSALKDIYALYRRLSGISDEAPVELVIHESGRNGSIGVRMSREVCELFGVNLEEKKDENDIEVEAVRNVLLARLIDRVQGDLDVLLPHLRGDVVVAPVARLALVLRLGKTYIALNQACAACVGGEQGRAARHAFDDAAADLMADVAVRGA